MPEDYMLSRANLQFLIEIALLACPLALFHTAKLYYQCFYYIFLFPPPKKSQLIRQLSNVNLLYYSIDLFLQFSVGLCQKASIQIILFIQKFLSLHEESHDSPINGLLMLSLDPTPLSMSYLNSLLEEHPYQSLVGHSTFSVLSFFCSCCSSIILKHSIL